MNKKQKEIVNNKLYQMLKKDGNVTEVTSGKEDDTRFYVRGNMCHGILFDFNIMVAGDIATCNAEVKVRKDEDADINIICDRIISDTTLRYGVMGDNDVKFMAVIPFNDMTNEEAERKLCETAEDFYRFFVTNAQMFVCENEYKENLLASSNEEAEGTKKDDSATPEDSIAIKENSKQETVDEVPAPMDLDETDYDFVNSSEVDYDSIDVEGDSDSSAFRGATTAENIVDGENLTESDDDIFSDEMSDDDLNNLLAMLAETSEDDDDVLLENNDSRKTPSGKKSRASETTKSKTNEKDSNKSLNASNKHEARFVKKKEDAQTNKNTLAGDTMDNVSPSKKKEGDISYANRTYTRNPSVEQQYQDMYAEIDAIFARKQKDADAREEMLNVYSENLSKRSKEIEANKISLEIEREEYRKKQDTEFAEKIKEQEDIYRQKEKDLQYQYYEDTRALKAEVERREKDCTLREGKLKEAEESLVGEQKRIEFEWKKINIEKDGLVSRSRDLDERARIIGGIPDFAASVASNEDGSVDQSDVDDLRDEVSKIKKALEKEQKKNATQTKVIAAFQTKQLNWKKEADALKKNSEKLKNQAANLATTNKQLAEANKHLNTENNDLRNKATSPANNGDTASSSEAYDELRSKYDELYESTDKKIVQLQNDNEHCKSELADCKSKLDDSIKQNSSYAAQIEELKSTCARYENGQKDAALQAPDLKKEAIVIREALRVIGVNLEVVPGQGDMILSGERNGSLVCINVKAHMGYCETPVKKPLKHVAQLEAWSQEDIRVSYMTGSEKVICKYVYNDISKDTLNVLTRLDSLK